MFTSKRLDKTYNKSEKITFDNGSRFVIMSDVHRGDNSVGDEFGQNRHIYYHALQYYYEDDFVYIEAGDGDELWETPSYKYIRSSYSDIFKMLRRFHEEGRLIMLYGNHNVQLANPSYIEANMTRDYDDFLGREVDILPGLRVRAGVTLVHENTGLELLICHGHQGDFWNDYFWRVSYLACRYIWRFFHRIGFNYAASPAKNRFKRTRIERSLGKWLDTNDKMLVCGHTHRARLPQPGEKRYFNAGCCMHPRGITCIEISYGEISLVNWTVHTRKDGMLYIKRETEVGPFDLAEYKEGREAEAEKRNL